MQKMVDIIPITLRHMGIEKKYNSQSIIVHWKKIVGSEISTHAYPIIVQSGILVIGVNNSVWLHHLSMMKDNIISKINQFIGEKLILDIRFQAGYFKKFQNEENTDTDLHSSQKVKFNKIKLDESDVKMIYQTVEPIKDNYLKQKIIRTMRRDFLLKKIKKQSNWHQCASCTVLCPPDDIHCCVCKLTKKHEVITNIIGVLKQIPWIRHHELNEHIPCTDEEFHQAKYTLVSSIGRAIQDGDNDRFNIMIFIMLTTGAKIEAINEAIINKTLAKFRRRK